MKRFSTLAAPLAIGLMVLASATAADAGGWSRSRTTIGPNGGQYTFQGSGSCSGGSCSSNQLWTGPTGRTATRTGSSSCSGGACQGTAIFTGPGSKSFTRQRGFQRD